LGYGSIIIIIIKDFSPDFFLLYAHFCVFDSLTTFAKLDAQINKSEN